MAIFHSYVSHYQRVNTLDQFMASFSQSPDEFRKNHIRTLDVHGWNPSSKPYV